MALDNIHVEQSMMSTAVSRSSDVHSAIMDYEKQLTGIADMVKSVWGGRAKVAFDQKHQEIRGYLGVNSQDADSISQGTSQALNISVGADDDAYSIINAINGH
ncbi:hypothetical protein [Actinophytocola sp.]|uniref:hypothetical protein n=1 Tax=Actinophytocola sp. TaxID=1872138 RepID=UPI00389A8200